MQSGRFLLAVVLMIATVVIVNVIFPPVRPTASLPPGDSLAIPPDSAAPPNALPAVPSPAPVTLPGQPAVSPPPVSSDPAPVDTIVAESPLYRYGISTRGAALV